MKFSEWVEKRETLTEAQFQQVPEFAKAQSWDDLEALWSRYKGLFVQFKDYNGNVQIGKLVDLLYEGVFIVRNQKGEEFDVHAHDVVGVGVSDRPVWGEPRTPEIAAKQQQRRQAGNWQYKDQGTDRRMQAQSMRDKLNRRISNSDWAWNT